MHQLLNVIFMYHIGEIASASLSPPRLAWKHSQNLFTCRPRPHKSCHYASHVLRWNIEDISVAKRIIVISVVKLLTGLTWRKEYFCCRDSEIRWVELVSLAAFQPARINLMKLACPTSAGWRAQLTASAFNWLAQYASSPCWRPAVMQNSPFLPQQ